MAALRGDRAILIRKLSPQTTEEALGAFLEQAGDVIHLVLARDSLTGEPTGNAHCVFSDKDEAKLAIATLNGKTLGGADLEITEVPQAHLVLKIEATADPTLTTPEAPRPHTVIQNPLKLSLFSGDPRPKGGEVSFEAWRQEIDCLKLDEVCSPNALARLVRRSLRGEAGQLVLNMGVDVGEIVSKLEGFYGTVESGAVLLQQLYASKQGPDETIAAYSARLQLAIDKAQQRGGVSPTAQDETLHVVFWKGLCNESMKQAIRHRYETVGSFDELVRLARLAEQESEDFQKFHSNPMRPRPRIGAHVAQVDRQSALEKEVNELKAQLREIDLKNRRAANPNPRPIRPNNGVCYNCNRPGHFAGNAMPLLADQMAMPLLADQMVHPLISPHPSYGPPNIQFG